MSEQPPQYPTDPHGQQPPQQPAWTPPPGAYPPGAYVAPPPTPGNATTALILGILSLVMCGLFTGIPAWIIGRNAVKEIDASQGQLGGRSTAQTGYVLGIVGTVLSLLGIVLLIAIFAAGAFWFDSIDCTSTETADEFSFSCD